MMAKKPKNTVNTGYSDSVASSRAQDSSGTSVDFSTFILQLANVGEDAPMMQITDIDSLRKTEPTHPGVLAAVLEYNKNTKTGGGIFMYDEADKKTAEDYGLNIVTAKGARWKRILFEYNNLTVLDFGAVADGKTDCTDAIKRMFNWSQANYPTIGIRFSAGKFFISKFDISAQTINRFKLSGAPISSGYFSPTTLVSDRANNQVMFTVKARFVEISALVVDGESKTSAVPAANSKGFFKNIEVAGQFLRVSGMQFNNLGGRGLDVQDTLDCKIDQWYGSHCQNAIIYARWSDTDKGGWNHSTAIELSNFNIQYNSDFPAIDIPRATQSLLRNGWIEHSDDPGDLSNGQWIIEALSIEDCKKPMKMAYCRAITLQKNIQGGNGLDFSPAGTRWLSEYEDGNIELGNNGVIINGSLNYDYITSQYTLDNRSDKETWFYIGDILMKQSQQAHMRLIGSAQFNSMGSTQLDYSDRTPEGVAHIYFQVDNSQIQCSWHGEGSCPVVKVHTEKVSGSECRIYVKLALYTGFCKVLVDTNAEDRFEAGVHFIYRKVFTKCDATKAAALDEAVKTPVVFEQHWTGNKNVGFGYNHNGELLLHAAKGAVADFNDATELLKVRINGLEYALEVRKKK